jgi:hypothetical protein
MTQKRVQVSLHGRVRAASERRSFYAGDPTAFPICLSAKRGTSVGAASRASCAAPLFPVLVEFRIGLDLGGIFDLKAASPAGVLAVPVGNLIRLASEAESRNVFIL